MKEKERKLSVLVTWQHPVPSPASILISFVSNSKDLPSFQLQLLFQDSLAPET